MNIRNVIIIFGIFVICLGASFALAQDNEDVPGQVIADFKGQFNLNEEEETLIHSLSALQDRLNLTEEQIAQLRPILEEQRETFQAIVAKYKEQGLLGMRSLKDEILKNREDIQKRLATILNEQQLQEIKKFQDELRQKLQEKVFDQILSGLQTRLNLTEEQVAQIRPIIEESITKRRELVEKYQEQGREGFKAFRKENKQIQRNTKRRLAPILTEEQMQAFEAFQDELQERIFQEISRWRSS